MAASTTPFNTFKTFLMHGTGTTSITYTKLVDIKTTPDLKNAPATLDATTLSDPAHVYILDIADTGGVMEFTANYTLSNYNAIKALEGSVQKLAVWFGATVSGSTVTPNGDDGKFPFEGYISVRKTGSSVSGVQEMAISIAPTTLPEVAES